MKYPSRILVIALALGWTGAAYAATTSYVVDPAESVFAVVTHKAGVAARFAHNHLIAPQTYTCPIERTGGSVEDLTFSLSFPVAELAVDLPGLQKKWYPAIKALALLDTPFTEIDESDRATIEEHMLAQDQLDARLPFVRPARDQEMDVAFLHLERRRRQRARRTVTIRIERIHKPFTEESGDFLLARSRAA